MNLRILLWPLASLPLLLHANTFVQNIAQQELVNHGQEVFTQRCIGCHGTKGDGMGPASQMLDPKPRDFTKGIFKFKSTPIGSLPTDEDLMKTLTQGVLGTSMPAFAELPQQSRTALIEYIKTFSSAWQDKTRYARPVQGAPMPEADLRNPTKFLEYARRGKTLFIESCAVCHGAKGLGDGPGSVDLEDDWGQPIKPGNLTHKTVKSGKSAKDIYGVLLTGIDGTPMPSFKETYTDEKLWDLVAFVLYLRGVSQNLYDHDSLPIEMIKKEEIE